MRAIVFRFLIIVVALAATAPDVGTRAQTESGRRAWPPGVQVVPESSPPRSPEEEHGTFHLAPGYRIELVASEPLVQDPVAIDWDARGRLWVVEMPGYMEDIRASTEHEPTGRVVVLEDTDADGRMDRRRVFAEDLVLARSVKVLDQGVLVGEPPHVWLMRDNDGDLRMDEKTQVTDRFGARAIDVQNNANGFDWGLDNRLRTSGQSSLHLQLKGGAILAAASPTRGQWGVTHDDVGRTYRNSNESALHVDVVAGEIFARNPNLLRTRGSYERLTSDTNALNVVWPVRPTPGVNRGYQAGIRRADGSLARYTAACSPVVYRGDRLPAEAQGNVFVADPAGNLVSRIVVREGSDGVRASRAYPDADFLASTDERFRPVFLANAPDGTLTVVDMYRGVIEHRLSLTQYLKDEIERRALLSPRGLGRIWRVIGAGQERDMSPLPSRSGDLVTMLAHPNGWRRDTAQRLLVERGDAAQVAALQAALSSGRDPRLRLHALATLDGMAAVAADDVQRALRDPSPAVRAAAIRAAEPWLAAGDGAWRTAVFAAVSDPDRHVRLQAIASLGLVPDETARVSDLAAVLSVHGDDPMAVDVALSGLRGAESRVLERLVTTTTAAATAPPPGEAIAIVAATVFRAAREQEAQAWLARLADPALPVTARQAVMHGAEIGLLGAPLPGVLPPLVNPALTCATCPGGRLSTGGAYAFTDPASFARPPAAGRLLRLTRAPASFVALAAQPTPFGQQAAAVLTHVSWPGKPGDADAPVPLTAEEQARFEQGRALYRSYCQACHEADGRGLPGRAASLVGSTLALASSDVPVRILLHGKEGTTGLMPPIGSALDDAQVAAVLTYVRREWGHGAPAVDPATVRRIRAQTKARVRPWTDAELAGLR